jgi:hypothetical protein
MFPDKRDYASRKKRKKEFWRSGYLDRFLVIVISPKFDFRCDARFRNTLEGFLAESILESRERST